MSFDEITRQPTTGDLAAYAVGRPVSASHVGRIAQDVGYLLGQNTQPIIAQYFRHNATTSRSIRVSYTRNPGVNIILIEAEPHRGASIGSNGTLTLTSSAGSLAFASADGAAAAFDGTANAFTSHSDVLSRRRKHRVFVDVTGLTVGTTYDLIFAFVNGAGSAGGIAKLTILECPISTTNTVEDPTTDIGMDMGAIDSGLQISTNTLTSARGMARFLAQVDKCRISNKRHWQICTNELDADAFTTASASYALLTAGHAARNPTYRFRARRLYASSANNVYTLGFRYRVTGGVGKLQMLVDGVATQITGLTGTSYVDATTSINIPCNGATDQEVELKVEGACSGGFTIYCDRVRLLEAET